MLRQPPISTLTDPRCPYTTLFRSDGLCDRLGVPMDLLPEITGNTTTVGTTDPALFGGAIPISGMAGDQQAATVGQACLAPGQTKATFGTGAFILSASGTTRSEEHTSELQSLMRTSYAGFCLT